MIIKTVLIISWMIGISSFFIPVALAQTVTPQVQNAPIASQSGNTGLDNASNTNQVANTIKNFFKDLDASSGGFIFSTADFFANTIQLPDGATIGGLQLIRTGFNMLGVVIAAIILLWMSSQSVLTFQLSFLRTVVGRIAYYAFVLVALPLLFGYSIQATNLLSDAILNFPSVKEQQLTTFTNDYFTKLATQPTTNTNTVTPNINAVDFISSPTNSFIRLLFLVVTIIALAFGLLFIILQFVLRFLSLFFLSLIYPVVIPFVLSEKTENFFYSYLKIWFTFLIHQPAFALGYVLVMYIVRAMFTTNGATLSLLFLYIGALFFLGTVNILVARIFADSWVALGANFEAAAAARMIPASIKNSISGIKAGVGAYKWGKGKIGAWKSSTQEQISKRIPNFGDDSVVYDARYGGLSLNSGIREISRGGEHRLNQGIRGGVDTVYGQPPEGSISNNPINTGTSNSTNMRDTNTTRKNPYIGSYSRELKKKGFFVKPVNKENGVVSLTGEGYSYYDQKHNLTYTYPTKQDAYDAGVGDSEIKPAKIFKEEFVDLSQFEAKDNPHNTAAIAQAKRTHFRRKVYLTHASDPQRMRDHLEINKDRFTDLGVNGLIVKRADNFEGERSKGRVTRIVKLGKEKA
ncbi:MAG: hypothetical protein ACREHC_01520 [Candidatus Levyibacteriota bacterium]